LLLTFFYRHMPALIENNFVYIAQPPLYRVTRKKISRYIHNEKEMDDYLLELGISDVKIKLPNHPDFLTYDKTKECLNVITEAENFVNRLEKKGITFREFISLKNEANIYPRFQVNLSDEVKYAYSSSEFEAFRKADEEFQRTKHQETLASIPQEEITEEMKVFTLKRLHYIELYEEETLKKLLDKLSLFGFSFSQYQIATGPLLDIMEGEDLTTFYTLKETIDFLRANGRKGIEIQRYKGLGEMNADQLWETTMDPTKRKLIKITLPDAIAADHMFTKLMGDEVPPRRLFIESHALSVKNLDI